jgi:excisionase family DNA binding protein
MSTRTIKQTAPTAPAGTPLTYTIGQAAKLLQISRASAYEAVRTGSIPSIRIGRTIRVPRAALEAKLAAP